MSKNHLHLVKINYKCHLVRDKKYIMDILLSGFYHFIYFLIFFVSLSFQMEEMNIILNEEDPNSYFIF